MKLIDRPSVFLDQVRMGKSLWIAQTTFSWPPTVVPPSTWASQQFPSRCKRTMNANLLLACSMTCIRSLQHFPCTIWESPPCRHVWTLLPVVHSDSHFAEFHRWLRALQRTADGLCTMIRLSHHGRQSTKRSTKRSRYNDENLRGCLAQAPALHHTCLMISKQGRSRPTASKMWLC